MFTKDKYSVGLIHLFICIIILIIFLYSKNVKGVAASFIIGVSPLVLFMLLGRSRLHLSKNQLDNPDIEYKTEKRSGFSKIYSKNLDGVRLNNKRYKMVDGVDIFMNDKKEFKPVGFGSALMQTIFGGGYEPESIQNDPKWK